LINENPAAGGASAPARQLECINPATGEKVGALDLCSVGEVPGLVKKAREAYGPWRERGFDARAAVLRKARDILLDRKEEVLDLLVEETGKVRCDAIADVLVIAKPFNISRPRERNSSKIRRLIPACGRIRDL